MRKVHLYLAIPAGIIISMICFTGALMVWEEEITQSLHPEWFTVQPVSAQSGHITEPLTPSQVVAHLRGQVSDTLTVKSISYPSTLTQPLLVSFEQTGRKQLVVHPQTGKVIGWKEKLPFFTDAMALHRWLLNRPMERGQMTVGKGIVGVAVLFFVFILLSGIVIWIPRNRKSVSKRTRLHFHNGWKRFFFDTHTVLGIYAVSFLFIMAVTGLCWSFGWWRTGALALFGISQPPREQKQDGKPAQLGQQRGRHGQNGQHGAPGQHHGAERGEKTKAAAVNFLTWDKALSQAKARYPHASSMDVSVGQVSVNTSSADDHHMRRDDQLAFADSTGQITQVTPYEEQPAARRAQGIIYQLHIGAWGGMTTRIIYFIVCLLGTMLPYTGALLWWHHRQKRKANEAKLKARQ